MSAVVQLAFDFIEPVQQNPVDVSPKGRSRSRAKAYTIPVVDKADNRPKGNAMDVTLIGHTPDALEVLLFTKQTRLSMTPGMLAEIKAWPEEKKLQELGYMLNTIQSSWEFCDYIFLISQVPRSFTHQLVRTRTASYAHQSQRLKQGDEAGYHVPDKIADDPLHWDAFCEAMDESWRTYHELIGNGADPQDAREVLPNAMASNIVMKANLRTLHDTMLKRLCVRTQGLAQDVFRAMRREVIEVHPWAEPFLRVWCGFHGTCQFHRHPTNQCPVKHMVYNPEAAEAYGGGRPATLEDINLAWELRRAAPQPVVISHNRDPATV